MVNLDFQRIGEGLLIDQDYWGNLEIELDDKIYKRRKENNKMKVELESKYEIGDKVYIFDQDKTFYSIVKIKFDLDVNNFLYLLEDTKDERYWYVQQQVHKSIDKE